MILTVDLLPTLAYSYPTLTALCDSLLTAYHLMPVAHPSLLTTCHSPVTSHLPCRSRLPFATLIPPPLTPHYLPVTFHHSSHAILGIRLPFLILPPLATHYLPVIFHHSSHTAPTYTAPTHYSSLITHHGPLTTLHTPLITHHSPLIAYSPLPIHDLPRTTHHSPLTTHHPRLCLSYSMTHHVP